MVAYLPKCEQDRFRKKLQKAYEQTEYRSAKQALKAISTELKILNESAVRSLDEGLEETLTLHRLVLFEQLGVSMKTTNFIESLNSQLEQYTRRVTIGKTAISGRDGLPQPCWKSSHRLERSKATDFFPFYEPG